MSGYLGTNFCGENLGIILRKQQEDRENYTVYNTSNL
jgi:hypothetical protein